MSDHGEPSKPSQVEVKPQADHEILSNPQQRDVIIEESTLESTFHLIYVHTFPL